MTLPWPTWAAAGAGPLAVAALLRSVAADCAGCAPEETPDPQPRWAGPAAAGGGTADYVSPLPARMAGAQRRPPGELAEELATRLSRVAGVDAAWLTRGNLLAVRVTASVRGSLLYAVGEGWDYLAGGGPGIAPSIGSPRAGVDSPGSDQWPRSRLEEADDLVTAIQWARGDTVARLGRFLDQPPMTRPVQLRTPTWRDPYLDAPAGPGEAAQLLATIGEASTRFAACRGHSPRPHPADQTGPDLPAVPTPATPGQWARNTAANPAMAVRYAHAHAWTTVHRWAPALGYSPLATTGQCSAAPAVGVLGSALAAPLLGWLFDGPGFVASAARRSRPHLLVRYLEGLCAAYHRWQDCCPVLPVTGDADRLAIAARLTVCAAVAEVLATGVFLLGVSAPTRL